MKKSRFPSRFRAAFTLVEIMAAMAIMLVVVGIVTALTTQVMTSWQQSTAILDSNQQARNALDAMEQDIISMFNRNDGKNWVELRWDALEAASGMTDPRSEPLPELMLLATIPDRPDFEQVDGNAKKIHGDLCAIKYQLALRNPFDPTEVPGVFSMYRAVMDAAFTFNYVLPALAPRIGNLTQEELWNSQASDLRSYSSSSMEAALLNRENVRDQTGSIPSWAFGGEQAIQHFIAADIVDLQIDFYYTFNDGNGPESRSMIADAFGGAPSSESAIRLRGDNVEIINGTAIDAGFYQGLDYVLVTMKVLSGEGSRLYARWSENPTEAPDTFKDDGQVSPILMAEEYGASFRRAIPILTKPQ